MESVLLGVVLLWSVGCGGAGQESRAYTAREAVRSCNLIHPEPCSTSTGAQDMDPQSKGMEGRVSDQAKKVSDSLSGVHSAGSVNLGSRSRA